MIEKAAAKKRQESLDKVLSTKAKKIGLDTGVTAEFIVQQTSEQLALKLEDLFLLFDTFQDVLYANDPAINTAAKDDKSSQRSRAGSAISRSSGKSGEVEKPQTVPASVNESSQGENRVMYEESILMTMLGPDYIQYISEETGEWTDEQLVLKRFQELFETRIRYIFDAEEEETESQYNQ